MQVVASRSRGDGWVSCPQQASLKGRKWVAISLGHIEQVWLIAKFGGLRTYCPVLSPPGSTQDNSQVMFKSSLNLQSVTSILVKEAGSVSSLRGSNQGTYPPPSLKYVNFTKHHSTQQRRIIKVRLLPDCHWSPPAAGSRPDCCPRPVQPYPLVSSAVQALCSTKRLVERGNSRC